MGWIGPLKCIMLISKKILHAIIKEQSKNPYMVKDPAQKYSLQPKVGTIHEQGLR